jgi:hypothetical protein
VLFFEFPRWNANGEAVEFSVILGLYEGTARIGRHVFQLVLDQPPTPERCVETFHLQRERFELIVECKLRRRQLAEDGNVSINAGRDLREMPAAGRRCFFSPAAAGLKPVS